MITPMGWLERVNTWKDSVEEMKATDTHNLGRFAYPVLQTADIALVKGIFVPVGKDQVAHLEVSREIIRRFNHLYGEVLPECRPLLTDTPAVPGTDGRKMSKSYNNSLFLTQDARVGEKQIKGMPTDPARVKRTDPGDPAKCPVFEMHKLFSTEEDREWVTAGCKSAGIGCGDCKARLIGNINALCEKPREIKKELLNNPKRLDSIIAEGCQRAREEAQKTLKQVRSAMKFHGGIR
jgi:tryptophanyl-tRNA synthetase